MNIHKDPYQVIFFFRFNMKQMQTKLTRYYYNGKYNFQIYQNCYLKAIKNLP